MLKWRVGPGVTAGVIYAVVGITLIAMPIGIVGGVHRAQEFRNAMLIQDTNQKDIYVADVAPSELANSQCRESIEMLLAK
jgi:hypothetical protein